MTYYARFSIIKDNYGLMGVEDKTFENIESLEELKEEINGFYKEKETKTVIYLLDELEDENGNEINIE